MPFYQAPDIRLYQGDALAVLATLPAESVQTAGSSPPFYMLRDYSVDGQLGLEPTLNAYLDRLVGVFREVRRVLRPDGVCWVEMGDSYSGGGGYWAGAPSNETSLSGHRAESTTQYKGRQPATGFKPKDLMLVPHRFAIAMQADGWWCRQDIVWHKLAPMPESVGDRCTRAHSYVFMFTRSEKYFYDSDAIREPAVTTAAEWQTKSANWMNGSAKQQQRGYGYHPWTEAQPFTNGPNPLGRNKRSVWSLSPEPSTIAHFATFPTALVKPCILAGSRRGDVVLDPFAGSGTTLLVARRLGRVGIGIELNPEYCRLAVRRIEGQTPALALDEATA